MAQFCEYCGAELLNGTLICSQCGAVLSGDAYTQPEEPQSIQNPAEVQEQVCEPVIQDEPQQPAKKPKKAKKWLIPVAAIAAVIVAGLFLWQPILKMVSPDAYIDLMLSNTNKALEDRMEDTPAGVVSSVSDSMDDGSVDIDITYRDEYEGEMKGGIKLHSNTEDQKWRLDADISAMGIDADISAYVDGNAFAIGSNALTGGKFYGLTYNSFEEDLRSSAFAEMLDDESITAMTTMVDSVDQTLEFVANFEKRLEPYIAILTKYQENMETKSGSEKLELDGKDRNCSTVAYIIDQNELVKMLSEMLKQLENEEEIDDLNALLEPTDTESVSEIVDQILAGLEEINDSVDVDAVVTYYIYNSKVVNIKIDVTLENTDSDDKIEAELSICYGTNPEKDDIVVECEAKVDGEKVSCKIVSSDNWDGDEYTGSITVTAKASGEKLAEIEQKTVWNKKSGDLKLSVSSADEEICCSLDLIVTDNGCTIEIDDVYDFLCEISPDFAYEDAFDCSIKMTFAEGGSVDTPTFTNLDKIDQTVLEELMTNVEAFVTDNSEIIGSLGGAFEDDSFGDIYEDDYIEDDYFEDDYIEDDYFEDDYYFDDDYEDVVIEDIWN